MPFPLDRLKELLSLKPGQEGGVATFEQEALKHLTSLYNFALGLTKNESDAADLVQETYLRALRFRHRFQAGTNLRAWLFKILRNAFIDSYWRRTRELVMEDLEPQAGSATLAEVEGVRGAAPGPLNRAVRLDLTEALEQLPDPFRIAILLSDVHGLSVQEIAEIMDCPANTVKTRLFRGRRFLRERLKDYGS
ncbi:MAG: sigma-70 family RNA polymerase sigma factor [Acidobacteria bacterium]|nr:sigma-70 family RNA polymerase sigma factor [Acidobacteriota bacterium]